MRKFSITKEFEALLYQIRRDIFLLKQSVRDEKRIKISVPSYYRVLFDNYNYIKMAGNIQSMQMPNFDTIYGIEIVNGYNNQICVFDEYAQPGDEFLEPILITL